MRKRLVIGTELEGGACFSGSSLRGIPGVLGNDSHYLLLTPEFFCEATVERACEFGRAIAAIRTKLEVADTAPNSQTLLELREVARKAVDRHLITYLVAHEFDVFMESLDRMRQEAHKAGAQAKAEEYRDMLQRWLDV